MGILNVHNGCLKGARAGSGPVDDSIDEGFCFCVDAVSTKNFRCRTTHDPRTNRFYAQEAVKKRGTSANHPVRGGKTHQIYAVIQPVE